MNIKDLLNKIITGDQLTAEDTEFLQSYDPEAEKNTAAAAARRKADEAAQALREQLEALNGQLESKKAESMTAAEKLEKTIADLMGKVTNLEKAKSDAEAAVSASQRKQAIGKIRATKGISFVPGIDPDIAEGAWERAFADLPDLGSVQPSDIEDRVKGFVTKNAAIILDTSGKGSGLQSRPGTVLADAIDTPAARAADMKAKGLL